MNLTPTDELSLVECLDLLSGHRFGRVVYSERALPAIQTVTYALVGTHVVVGPVGAPDPAPGRDLASCLQGQVVVFEIDHAEPTGGWTVVVIGTARTLPMPAELQAWDAAPWAGGWAASTVAIDCSDIRGRRLHAMAG